MADNRSRLSLYEPREIGIQIGRRARTVRLAANKRQADLAAAAGVTLSTLRRFESTGRVGFEVVVRIALALGAVREFAALFPTPPVGSIDDIVKARRTRSRARKSQ